MRVYPLGDKLFDNIQSKLRDIDKQLPQKVLADKTTPTNLLIVLGDGREDDVIVPLICHHLNGDKTTAILKPTSTRYGAIQTLKPIVKNYNAIAFILDQENDELSTLSETIMRKLNESGAVCEEKENLVGGRVMGYEYILGGHRFKFVVVVNGLDDVGGSSHKIEDHLVKLAGVAGQGDSKDVWNGLDGVKKMDVFRKIHGDGDVARKVFGQHFMGFGLLDC